MTRLKLNQSNGGTRPDGVPIRLQPRYGLPSWSPPAGSVWVDRPPWLPDFRAAPGDRDGWVRDYERWLRDQPDLVARARRELGGRTLICPCGPEHPCHADVLLRVANNPEKEDHQ